MSKGTLKVGKVVKIIFNILMLLLTIFIVLLVFLTVMTQKNEGKIFGLASYIVKSDSMKPTFSAGSFIIARAVKPEDLNLEDIVVFWPKADPNERVTHRIKKIETIDGQLVFTTKGDNPLNAMDPPMEAERVVGKTIFYVPYLGVLLNDMKNGYFIFMAGLLIALMALSEYIFGEDEN